MYDLVDRSISVLPEGSRFLLWAMRAWVASRGNNACPPARLGPAFLKMSAIDALPHFHIAMSALNIDAKEVLHFHCMHRPEIGESEAVLLRLWSDLAAGEEGRTIRLLELMVKEEAVTTIFSAMRAALPGLQAAGLAPVIAPVDPISGGAQ